MAVLTTEEISDMISSIEKTGDNASDIAPSVMEVVVPVLVRGACFGPTLRRDQKTLMETKQENPQCVEIGWVGVDYFVLVQIT